MGVVRVTRVGARLSAAVLRIVPDSLMRLIVGGMAAGLLARLALTLMNIGAGRVLGPERFGVFAYALTLAFTLSTVTPLGLQLIVPRLMADYDHRHAWGRFRAVIRGSVAVTVVLSLGTAIVMIVAADRLVRDQGLASAIVGAAVLLPVLGMKRLLSRGLVGLGRTHAAIFLNDGAAPLLVLPLLLLGGLGSGALIAGYGLASSLVVGIMVHQLRRDLPVATRTVPAEYAWRDWMGPAIVAAIGAGARIALNRLDILMVAPMLDVEQAGYYAAASRICALFQFVQGTLGTLIAPLAARAGASDQRDEARRMFMLSLAVSIAIALPVLLLLVGFPRLVLSTLFGPSFVSGETALRVLAVGGSFNALTGPVTAWLVMRGRERAVGASTVLALLVATAANLALIPRLGLFGAALVAAAAAVSLNLWQLGMVLRAIRSRDA
jgi:O-antigen/teichoic acid export membrane protein